MGFFATYGFVWYTHVTSISVKYFIDSGLGVTLVIGYVLLAATFVSRYREANKLGHASIPLSTVIKGQKHMIFLLSLVGVWSLALLVFEMTSVAASVSEWTFDMLEGFIALIFTLYIWFVSSRLFLGLQDSVGLNTLVERERIKVISILVLR